jgi:thioredoxin 1
MKQLIKFSATWCGPCKALAGSMKYVDFKDVELVDIDVDKDPETTKNFDVRGVPTLILVEDGKEIGRKSGVLMANQIEQFIHG